MKILIIKFSALGDVLRTTALLRGLKKRFSDTHITWLTDRMAIGLLQNNQYIDNPVADSKENIELLKRTTFDLLISLDKEAYPTALAMELKAKEKVGFGRDRSGEVFPLNKESEYAYRLGVSDELKFKKNKKTYQEIIFEMNSLHYQRDRYVLNLDSNEVVDAGNRLKKLGIEERDFIVGLNTGAGDRFANKAWTFENCLKFIGLILDKTHAKILLLGGRKEVQMNTSIESMFKHRVYNSGGNNSLRGFANIIKHCDVVIGGDTLAIHMGIALDRYVIALFGPTCHQEIELYGRGAKLVSDMDCAPCYKRSCSKKDNCMSMISAEKVFKEVARVMRNGRRDGCKTI